MWHFLVADYKQKGSSGQIRSYYEIILKAKASTVLHSGKHSRMISCYYGAYFCPDLRGLWLFLGLTCKKTFILASPQGKNSK